MTVRVNSGLDRLVATFESADRRVLPEAEKVVGKGCGNIKKDWKARWRNLTALRGLPHTINYDVVLHGDTVIGEVGPDHRRGGQSTLAHIPEYGMARKNTRPHPGGRPALEAEAPKFERALGDLGEDLLR